MVRIHSQQPGDIAAVRALNEASFSQPGEADIVDALRVACPDALSLVALCDNEVVGHILFSPVTVEDESSAIQGMELAPMAVLPEHQRQGIGSRMVEDGLWILRQRACPLLVVLGHPGFYPRFGFVPAYRYGLTRQWGSVPDEASMARVLDEEVVAGLTGVTRFREEFDATM